MVIYHEIRAASLVDLNDLAQQISVSEEERQKSYEVSRKIQSCLVQARAAVEHNGGVEAA
jgi:hypothetical protein